MSTLPRIAFGSIVVAAALVACSDDDPATTPPSEDLATPSVDAARDTSVDPVPDAALDSRADARHDARADAGLPANCTVDGWCHTDLPPGTHLTDVWSDGAGTTWAVSEAGHDTPSGPSRARILRWDGKSWSIALERSNLLATSLAQIWGGSPMDIWCRLDGVLFHGQGATPASIVWTPWEEDAGGPRYVASFAGTGPNDLWAVSSPVWHYRGPTKGWISDDVGGLASRLFHAAVRNDEVLLAGWEEASGGLLVRGRPDGDGGVAWTRIALPNLPVVDGYTIPTPMIQALTVDATGAIWLSGPHWESEDEDENEFEHAFIARGKITGDALEYDRFFSCRPNVTCNGPRDRVLALWAAGGVVYSAGDGFGAVGSTNGTTWRVERIALDDVPLIGPFAALHGSNEIWSVGGQRALFKRLVP